MTEQQPGSLTKTIERLCTACGKPVTLSWRKGGNFGGRCGNVTDVLGKDSKPTQCGTWIALTPVQSRAIVAKLEKETPNDGKEAAPPREHPQDASRPPVETGAKPRAERKPKPANKPADDPPSPAAERRVFLTWGGKRIF